MEQNIFSRIKIEELKEIQELEVPSNYFENLEESILAKINIESMQKLHAINTPENYFEDLELNILAKTKIDKMQKLHDIKTPDSYFEDLENKIFSQVKIESLKDAGKLNTPDGYFESLENKILSKSIAEKKPTFTIFRNKVVYFRNAAAVLLIGAMSVLVYKQNNPKDQFAEISSDEMVAYLNEQTLTETELTTVVDENTLEEVSVIPTNAELSDKELQKYLEENDI